MPKTDSHVVLALPNAGSSAVGKAVDLLLAHGFEVTQKPFFGPEDGGAGMRKGDLEVSLVWFQEAGLSVSCRNRAFERQRDELVDLLRALKHAP